MEDFIMLSDENGFFIPENLGQYRKVVLGTIVAFPNGIAYHVFKIKNGKAYLKEIKEDEN